jgi:hypothetical protein
VKGKPIEGMMVEEPTNYPRLIYVAPKNLGKL